MELWKIFVLATVKLGLNCDFDRLQELANQHNTLRQMLGHSGWEDTTAYKLQTIIDNVSALKPSVLAEINQVIVEACINNLEIRGLNRCLSYGQEGFERHVALSIVATNLHRTA